MGVEPTMASSSLPTNGFEDRGDHRASTTPTNLIIQSLAVGVKGNRDGIARTQQRRGRDVNRDRAFAAPQSSFNGCQQSPDH